MECLTESFQADQNPRERGSRPLNSSRWRGASRRPNGTGVTPVPLGLHSAPFEEVPEDVYELLE